MGTPHKWASVIKAWADGAEIEFKMENGEWKNVRVPTWFDDIEYRIRPEPKQDIVRCVTMGQFSCSWSNQFNNNLKLTFDSETGKLKSAEVINND